MTYFATTPETKKTLINSVIQRLDGGGGGDNPPDLWVGRHKNASGELLAQLSRPNDEKPKVVLRLE